MSTTAELIIEPDGFLLGGIIAEFPDLTVELERVVPSKRRIVPYLWGYAPDLTAFETALEKAPSIRNFTVLDRIDDGALYKLEWKTRAERLVVGLSETNATILEAHGTDHWRLLIRFEDTGGLRAFDRYCDGNDLSYRLARVNPITDSIVEPTLGLTREQERALAVAAARGYFEIPRKVTMADIAGELDISEQAVSERIRRGLNKVLNQLRIDAGSIFD